MTSHVLRVGLLFSTVLLSLSCKAQHPSDNQGAGVASSGDDDCANILKRTVDAHRELRGYMDKLEASQKEFRSGGKCFGLVDYGQGKQEECEKLKASQSDNQDGINIWQPTYERMLGRCNRCLGMDAKCDGFPDFSVP